MITSFNPSLLEAEATAVRRLARTVPLRLSGPGAPDALCTRLGVRRLDDDVVEAANEIAHGPNS